MIEQLAYKMAIRLKSSVPDHPSSVDIFKFAISHLLNILLTVLLTFSISLLTQSMPKAMLAMLFFAIFRQLTGGVHIKSNSGCVVFSTLLFVAISLIDFEGRLIWILNIAAFILFFLFAPAGIDKQSSIPRRYYPYLKATALLLVVSNVWFDSATLALCFFVQAVTLIFERYRIGGK